MSSMFCVVPLWSKSIAIFFSVFRISKIIWEECYFQNTRGFFFVVWSYTNAHYDTKIGMMAWQVQLPTISVAYHQTFSSLSVSFCIVFLYWQAEHRYDEQWLVPSWGCVYVKVYMLSETLKLMNHFARKYATWATVTIHIFLNPIKVINRNFYSPVVWISLLCRID